jgi:hypothetical protein
MSGCVTLKSMMMVRLRPNAPQWQRQGFWLHAGLRKKRNRRSASAHRLPDLQPVMKKWVLSIHSNISRNSLGNDVVAGMQSATARA